MISLHAAAVMLGIGFVLAFVSFGFAIRVNTSHETASVGLSFALVMIWAALVGTNIFPAAMVFALTVLLLSFAGLFQSREFRLGLL